MPQHEPDGAAGTQPGVVDTSGFVAGQPAGRFQLRVLPPCAAVLFVDGFARAPA